MRTHNDDDFQLDTFEEHGFSVYDFDLDAMDDGFALADEDMDYVSGLIMPMLVPTPETGDFGGQPDA